jgi:hypothetical protein
MMEWSIQIDHKHQEVLYIYLANQHTILACKTQKVANRGEMQLCAAYTAGGHSGGS